MSSVPIHNLVCIVFRVRTNDTLWFSAFSVFLITFPSTTKLLLRAPFPPFVLSQTKTFSSFLNTTMLHFLYILQSVGDQCAFHIVQIYYEFS